MKALSFASYKNIGQYNKFITTARWPLFGYMVQVFSSLGQINIIGRLYGLLEIIKAFEKTLF